MLGTSATVGVLGISYGATAVGLGFPGWFPVALAMVVVAASAEFVLISILATHGGVVAAVAAGLILNLRHLPYGVAVHDALGDGWRRLLACHLVNDETVAFATAEADPERRRAALRVAGVGVIVCWPAGALAGAVAGSVIGNPDTFGLDAVFPSVMAVLVLPKLTGRVRTAALTGAAITLGTTAFLPAGLPILLALVGLIVLAVPRLTVRRTSL